METTEQNKKSILGQELFYWLQTLVIPLVCVVLVFTFVGRVTVVVGKSMDPSLANGELLLIQSLGYTPQRGDIVVVSADVILSGEPIVKRIIATGGQTVAIDYAAGTVTVDGVVLEEDYIYETMRPLYDSTTYEVPEGHVFVMGDNRNHSTDSRSDLVGSVPEEYILGGARLVLYPFDKIGLL